MLLINKLIVYTKGLTANQFIKFKELIGDDLAKQEWVVVPSEYVDRIEIIGPRHRKIFRNRKNKPYIKIKYKRGEK